LLVFLRSLTTHFRMLCWWCSCSQFGNVYIWHGDVTDVRAWCSNTCTYW